MAGDTPGSPPTEPGLEPTETPASPAAPAPGQPVNPHPAVDTDDGHGRASFLALAIGAVGVVFGDIGTSPLYAMREALAHSRSGGLAELAVLGTVSLMLWALILVVTVKYVLFLMRADNKGEGGTLALMALAQRAIGQRSTLVFFLGVCGAALFYGDGILTPAVSVLSAVEGLGAAPGLGGRLDPYILPIAAVILIGLFMVQSRGTASMAKAFGPITAVWFVVMAGMGAWHITDDPSILRALSPHYGILFLIDNGVLGFILLGSVFLAVTGAEALYTDMGHFGRAPIRAGWLVFILPCLVLTYLGQGALVLSDPEARLNPFWAMIPEAIYWPVLILATMATVIASQAVITGAFSLTQQAVQLGLFPRISILQTSESQAGQVFVPSVNALLLIGVMVLLFMFPTSSQLAGAYGVSVTGAMLVDTLLAWFILRRLWKWSLPVSLLGLIPFLVIDVAFFSSNLLKIPQGAWVPLVLAGGLILTMWTWTRGTRILTAKTRKDSLPLADLIAMLAARPPHRAPGTAIFLTSDPDVAPVALMHNLKHNKVLHEKNVILTVRTADRPRVAEDKRVEIEVVSPDFKKVILNYGFMESPHIPRALSVCRRMGLKFDIMSTSFFLGRRSVVPSAHHGMPLWQDKLYIFLMRNAANPTDFYHIPPGRVVEMGTQVSV